MEKSPFWETDDQLGNKFPAFYELNLIPFLRQMNAVHIAISYLFKIQFNNTLPFASWSPK
jgi:hypothetical protein